VRGDGADAAAAEGTVAPPAASSASAGRVRVKVCGVTRPEDAIAAEALGVDAIGVNFAASSRRRIDLARATEVVAPLGPFVARVGVFVEPRQDEVEDAIDRVRLHAVQLHGRFDAHLAAAVRGRAALIRALTWRPDLDVDALAAWPVDAVLVDGPDAGSGEPFDWAEAEALRRVPRWILAGGLTPQNVAQAIARLRPSAVDVASGVESGPGVKDAARMAAFVAAVRQAERWASEEPAAAPAAGPAREP
jgi:phosphoribosylanthranilate isomerase